MRLVWSSFICIILHSQFSIMPDCLKYRILQFYRLNQMASRTKQKVEEKKSGELSGVMSDKKISEYYAQIKQSKSKLQDYVQNLTDRVNRVVSHRLSKFVALHSEIIQQKDIQIKNLQESNNETRSSQKGSHLEKLIKTIKNYQLQIERLNTIKQMFRKQAQKFKIQLDIKQKQLDAAKKRQKNLVKKIWILQQDIKDIYNSENPNSNLNKTKIEYFCTPKKNIKQKQRYTNPANRILATEPTMVQSRQKLLSQIEEKYSGQKYTLSRQGYRQKYSVSSQQRRIYSNMKSNGESVNASYSKYPAALPANILPHRQVDLYGDLRMNLRKANRIRQTQPQFWNDKEKALEKEDFQAICLHGPKIMRQIQKVFINNYGEIKQIDEMSIDLLTSLFKCQNAIKILEIVLFNYTFHAIDHIQDHKQQFVNEISYDAPSIDNNEVMNQTEGKPKRIKMQKQLRKKFKNTIIKKSYDTSSIRNLDQ